MKTVYKILISISILCVLIYFGLQWKFAPSYEGEKTLEGINSSVDVYFDANGVPHIEAENQLDAYQALGYVHAQDRLWQMELMRRIASGRLSEVLGEATLETDKFFKAINMKAYHDKSLAEFDKEAPFYKMAEAYLKGINLYIEEGKTPVEFVLLGIEKKAYTFEDILNVIGYMSFSFAEAHKTDPLVTNITEDLGPAYGASFDGRIDPKTTHIKTTNSMATDYMAYSEHLNDILGDLPVPAFTGSNSWVLGPEKTKDGKVILANDPHIGYSQPGVWYQAHIKTPEYEMYGFHLALFPFPLLAHNSDYAYGLTMFQNDDMNFYSVESSEKNPNTYRYGDEVMEFSEESFEIKIKDKDPVSIDVRSTVHGPVMNDFIETIQSETPLSMSWIYLQRENNLLDALYQISHAKDMQHFKKGASMIHAPGLNVMYGDAKDNIAWWASAQLYKVKNSASTYRVMDGSNGEDDQLEWLDFENNPRAENPEWNYVYSANNAPDSVSGILYPGYYLAEDRAKRIVTLLDLDQKEDKESMMNMIGDDVSAVSPDLVEVILDVLKSDEKSMYTDVLENWEGDFDKESPAPTIYTKFSYEILHHTLADELGDKRFDLFMNTHLQKRFTAELLKDSKSIWWDDVRTKDVVESREDIMRSSWEASIETLQQERGEDMENWKWKNVHQLTHEHVMKDVPVLGSWLNVGPFEINGGNEVINNQLYQLNDSGIYSVTAGPSSRRIIDFSDIENSMGMVPTGQSGNPFSPFYDNLAEKFVDNEFVKLLMNPSEIREKSSLLRFNPN
jgi:penicillin amidase